MKKTIIFSAFFALFCFTIGLFGQNLSLTTGNGAIENQAVLIHQNDNQTTIRFDLNFIELVEVMTDDGIAFSATSSKAPAILEKGAPDLFYLTATFIIPDRGGSDLEISYGSFTDFENIEIVPSKGPIQRNVDPETLPYVKGDVYERDGFYPGTFTKLREPFIMRDVRGQSLDIYPVQYNPISKVLRVYSEVTVTVRNTKSAGVNEFTNQKRNKAINAEFDQLYGSMFLNHSTMRTPNHPYTLEEAGELLIICHPAFMDAMKPYVDWKRTIGRKTTLVSTATAGTTVAAIKAYVQNYYNDPNNDLTYILLVGDHAQIPTHTYNSQAGGSPNPAGSDHFYGQLVGSDPYIEVFVGRFSAETVAHVQTQVQRTIHYERDLTTADTWLSKALGLAANEGGVPGKGHDDPPEADHVHMNQIRTRMLNYGYDPVYQEYTCNAGIPNTTPAQISSRLNTGVGMVNYCNHGSINAWELCGLQYTGYGENSTTQPNHVKDLQNVGMLPYIISVACVNGRFMSTTCFAEAWMRAAHNGQPTGAIAVLMATLNLWWNPPMTAQDAFVNICLDLPAYYPDEVAPGIKRTFGGAALNSTMLMMNIHGSANTDMSKEDFESWLIFGDPSLMLRTKTPQEMTVAHNDVIFFGMSEFPVVCDAEGAWVTMSAMDNDEVIILGTAVVEGGVANLNLYEPIALPYPLTLTVVGHNKVTYINTDIIATPAEGPYVVSGGYTVPNEGILTYISNNTEIEVTLKNVGVEATGTLTVTLSSNDTQLTFASNTATCGGITADGSATVTFQVTIANDIPDNKSFIVNVSVLEDGKTEPWDSKLALKAYAPDFSLEKVLVNGVEGGILEKESVTTFTAIVKNKGGADAFMVKGDLEVSSPYVVLACADELIQHGQHLPAGETMELYYTVATDSEMPFGHEASFDLLLSAQYNRSHTASFAATNTGSSNYCVTGSTNCGVGDKFTQVILHKTSEPGNLLINNLDGTCASNGYQDFTNTVVVLEPGAQYTIKVKCGYGSMTVKGWFDLNGNNIFDANEQLITLSIPSAGAEYISTFTVPAANFTPGTHRLRLRAIWSNSTFNVCDSYSYGQTHDYTIVLPELYPRVQNVEAVLNEESIFVAWDAPEEETPTGYNIYRNGNKLNTELLTTVAFTEEEIAEGVYVYNVTAVYGANESFAEMSNIVCNFTPILPNLCEAPVNLAAVAKDNAIIISWSKPVNIDGELSGYNLYRNELKVNEELLTGTEYRDEGLEDGTYVYQVSAFYEHCGESDKTAGYEIVYLGIYTAQTSSFDLFPNPATGEVTVKGEGLNRVEIYDLQGRKLNEYNNIENSLKVINLNRYENGVYFVKIYSKDNQTAIKRLVIVR